MRIFAASSMPGKLLVITGPTASGKTALAIRLAQALNTGIVNADSRQLYKELRIGAATPSDEELSKVPHFLIASHSIQYPLSAGSYEKEALLALENLFKKNEFAVLCGGSGLYIDAVLTGFDDLPQTDPRIRNSLNELYLEKGLAHIQEMLRSADPEYAAAVDMQNPRRIIRALEVCAGGQKYSELRKGMYRVRDFSARIFCIRIPRNELEARIISRTRAMIQSGLPEEVRGLLPFRNAPALQTVGYNEMFDHLEGKCSLEEAEELINVHTRQYARRQETWFRKKNCIYLEDADLNGILDNIREWD